MRSVLVTGAAGFIGSSFVRHALAQSSTSHVVSLDALTYAGRRENLSDLPSERHTFVEGDICDRDLVRELLQQHEIDLVVHLAAESHVDRSISGPAAFLRTNVEGTFTLLEAAREVWSGRQDVRFHHVSTDEVFGSLAPDDPPFSETTPYAPSSPYSATKAASDHLVRAYHRTYDLPVSTTNCSNNYGPRQHPEKLIPLVIRNGMMGRPIPVYGDGLQVRDWLHVEDHCDAIWRVATEAAPGALYTIGGDAEVSNQLLIRRICEHLDAHSPDDAPHSRLITHVEDRPGHDRRYAIDTGRIREDLGWRPSTTLDEGLARTVAWYVEHPEWPEGTPESV